MSDEGTLQGQQPSAEGAPAEVDRDALIAAAQEAGVPNPWFKSNADLQAALDASGSPAATNAPPEGADHPDPYAHLGSNAPTGDEPDEEE